MKPRASIVIPTYNHAHVLGDAIACALAQTVPCEVIVVDDGSTDDTLSVLESLAIARGIRVISLPHGGPSKARNAGLEAATAEFVMLLDADDVIAATKVADQLAAFTEEIGWVICDVRIEDAGRNRSELASDRYDYKRKEIGGWIGPMLEPSNFIPIMSPLVRRSVLAGLQFRDTMDGTPEDWRFWQKVASVARVRYLPKVLATYRKSKTGRNRLPKSARAVEPNIELPIRLNLGCGTPGTRSWHPIKGFVNRDKSLDWRFEDGLPEHADASVAGITISHALMYVDESAWPTLFSEFARVLEPGGVIRITEDDAENVTSARYGGWKGSDPAITRTCAAQIRRYLERAGFTAHDVTKDATRYRDRSLCQSQHGEPPDVFFIEGVRTPCVLFSPHNDDETLFAAFTILRHRPHVVVCHPSAGDYGDSNLRETETREAMSVLGAASVEQWNGGDTEAQMRRFDARVHPAVVFAPAAEASHPDHVAVALAAKRVFGDRVVTYHTYIDGEKVRRGEPVPYEPGWTEQKMRALLRYGSQLRHPRAHRFFLADLHEYQGDSQT